MIQKKINGSLWCVFPKGHGVAINVGHLKRASFLILNDRIMLQKIKTEDGERWAVVFHEATGLEEITQMTNGVIELMQTATEADTFNSANSGYYWSLDLLSCMLPTIEQVVDWERALKQTS